MATPVTMPAGLKVLEPYFVEAPQPLLTNKTVQLLLAREVLDYTILRTEETRELNTVFTPASRQDGSVLERVAFLAPKQKGAESREMGALLRTLNDRDGREVPECYLKDRLCVQCPRCVLYGATSTERGRGQQQANIKHRVAYSTAFSLDPYEDLAITTTFNGVSEATTLTGQTLNVRNAVRPAAVFPSVVALQSVTWLEFVLALKTIWKTHRYGAETRIGGEVRNTLFGVVAGWEEVVTALEYTLTLNDRGEVPGVDNTREILQDYLRLTSMPGRVTVLGRQELETLVGEVQEFDLPPVFVDAAYDQARVFRASQEMRLGQERGRRGT